MPPCLMLSIIRYGSRVNSSNRVKGVAIEKRDFGSPSTTVANFYIVYGVNDLHTSFNKTGFDK